ncbi:MAG: homing endonuclease associated repeat-containing protein [Actinomycetota bacterium]
MTREEIISALKQCAATLRHAPSHKEFLAHSGVTIRMVKKVFPTYISALTEAGLERRGGGHTLTMHSLFKDWAGVVRKVGKIPTMAEFGIYGRYSTIPYISRFVTWTQVPRCLHRFAHKEGLAAEYADVMTLIEAGYDRADEWVQPVTAATTGKPPSMAPAMTPLMPPTMTPAMTTSNAPIGEATGPAMLPTRRQILRTAIKPGMRRPILPDRPVYGAPMLSMALCNVPVNEMGVVFLFGMLARELGFAITRIQREYPDCEALRQMDDDRWQRIWIEFEFESRNFLDHHHDPQKCDLIVCWTHNWPECPIEVLELKSVMQEMGLVLPR